MDALKLFWGLLIILSGITLIGVNAGWWNSSIWFVILALWPVILIVFGLKLLIKDEKVLAMALFGLVVLTVALVVAGYRGTAGWFRPNNNFMNLRFDSRVVSESKTDTFDEKTIKKINITLSTGAAKVTVRQVPSGVAPNTLYQLNTQDMAPVSVTKTFSDDSVSLAIQEGSIGMRMMGRGMMTNREITLYLPSSATIKLSVDSGASRLNLDFRSLSMESLNLNVGASSGDFYLSERESRQNITLNAGASNLTFHIPAGLGVKATLDGGLNTVNSDSSLGLSKAGDSYLTTGFDESAKQVVITGSTGVSNIKFVRE